MLSPARAMPLAVQPSRKAISSSPVTCLSLGMLVPSRLLSNLIRALPGSTSEVVPRTSGWLPFLISRGLKEHSHEVVQVCEEHSPDCGRGVPGPARDGRISQRAALVDRPHHSPATAARRLVL